MSLGVKRDRFLKKLREKKLKIDGLCRVVKGMGFAWVFHPFLRRFKQNIGGK
jgi:hypothetical protein